MEGNDFLRRPLKETASEDKRRREEEMFFIHVLSVEAKQKRVDPDATVCPCTRGNVTGVRRSLMSAMSCLDSSLAGVMRSICSSSEEVCLHNNALISESNSGNADVVTVRYHLLPVS